VLIADVTAFLTAWLPDGFDLDDVHVREEAERAEVRQRLGLT
jgi:hypothetical protein